MSRKKRDGETTCPPHYWIIGRDDNGERWDCRRCAKVNQPAPVRYVNLSDGGCTWSREEQFLAGITD